MADANEMSLIAAHLAAALISKLPSDGLPAVQAVNLFNEVLAELNKGGVAEDERSSICFYKSSNGDVWWLSRNPVSGAGIVKHQPNVASGGKVTSINVDEFLRESPIGPQHQALTLLTETKS
jgi:hypothetical protein